MTYSPIFLFCAVCLQNTQTSPPAQQPEPAKQAPPAPLPARKAPTKTQSPKYVPLISGGITFSTQGMAMIKNGTYSYTDNSTNVPLETDATTTSLDHKVGAGVTVQVTPWDHFAVAIGAIYRETGYVAKTDYYSGTIPVNSPVDTRKHTGVEETTHLAFYDFPILVRYYLKDRYERGWRWFAEVGGTYRLAERIRSSFVIVDPNYNTTTSNTPVTPSKKATPGYTGGAGLEFIGPMRIHFMPEVRYSRWVTLPFKTLSTVSNRQQVEGVISFVF